MTITSTLIDRAEIQFYEPAGSLKPYVGCFWVVTAEREASIHIVPDGSTAISIRLKGDEPSGWSMRGPLVRSQTRRYAAGGVVVGIRLRPGVAFLLSDIAAHSMVGLNIQLSELPAFHELTAAEPLPCTPAAAIEVLQRFLIRRLQDANVNHVVAAAIREIEREGGRLQVSQIAGRCAVSSRHLNRLMRIWVGYGPKRFASIVRFQETLERIQSSPDRSAAALASEIGFFDQAHLTTNMTRFAGATPRGLASSSVAEFSKTRCDNPP
jgi:AraC-like DNA-binding protein